MRWEGHVACKEERRGAHRVLVRKLGKRRHPENLCVGGRITLEWILNGIGRNDLYWIGIAHDGHNCQAVVNAVMKLRFPQNTGNFLTCGRLI
jgi:hypothetical protein